VSAPAGAIPPLVEPPARWSLFLDLDGTLCPLVDRPEDVRLTEGQGALLLRLHELLEGAVCVLSGRGLADLRRIVGELPLPLIAAHGAQSRGLGELPADQATRDALQRLRVPLARLVAPEAGLRIEDKGHALAVHYRQRPELGDWLEAQMRPLAADSGLRLMHGNRVVELLPGGISKGAALRQAMRDPRFAGRTPVAVGDDVTDEDAFDAANALDGFGVAVGPRPSLAARFRLPCVVLVNTWLDAIAGHGGQRRCG
jgi:trehalose 6-phosphate phosphatase